MPASLSRRDLLTRGAAGVASLAIARTGWADAYAPPSTGAVPRRQLGRTGESVSILGLGGYHLGAAVDDATATRIVHEAIDTGINFFDNAWEYHGGKSEARLGKALAGGWRDKVFLMTKVCTHGRKADVAMQQLDESLRRLGTDHLDLWQIHECVYDDDPDLHFAADGVVEALARAKQQGKVRFVGFTGHKDPDIHLRMLAHGFAFDTVQMPLNCFDGSFRSFEQRVVPEVLKRGMAVIGMKSLSGAGEPVRQGVVTVEESLRYAMGVQGVSVTVSGIESVDVLRQNLAIVRGFQPMTDEEKRALRHRVREGAADGRHELYKMTMRYDAEVGRQQHGYPSHAEVPL